MNRTVTQRDVAKAAGVSQNTVSLALRDDPRIPVGTRARIHAVAQELGYRTNPLVAALMAQMKRRRPSFQSTLAMLMEGPRKKDLPDHPSLARALDGARERAIERGYRLEEFWLQDQPLPVARLETILRTRGIHGIIWHPQTEAAELPGLRWERYAAAVLAVIDRRFAAFHSASAQPFRHVETALTELAARGSVRPALAIPRRYEWVMDQLYSGAMGTVSERLGLSLVPPFPGTTWNKTAFLQWWREYRPDALLIRSAEVREWLKEAEVKIPGEIMLAHLGWHPGLRGWAGIDPAPATIGAAVIDLVIDQLNANERGLPLVPKMVLTGGHWIEGKTVRARPKD